MNEQKLLRKLGFCEPFVVNGRKSIAKLIPPEKRCGIYILYFEDGEFYAGQATNIARRYTEHRKHYSDIYQLAFKTVTISKLDQEEDKVIEKLEAKGFLLRNRAGTSTPKGEADFDQVMSETDQIRWLEDFNFIDDEGQRPEDSELRRKHRGEFAIFSNKTHAQTAMDTLRNYIRLGIPAFRRGEVSFWSVTCLPQANVYARININWQEVFVVLTEGDNLVLAMQLAASPLKKRSWIEKVKFRIKFPSYWQMKHRYGPGGPDQLRMVIPAEYFDKFIQEPIILESIRLFNLRLMKKGPNNPNNMRAHCIELADHLIE